MIPNAQLKQLHLKHLFPLKLLLEGIHLVKFHSQSDKAEVPIGSKAASKQTPLLMHMVYKVILPDHNYVVASQHELIPSVRGNNFPGMLLLILAQRTVQFEVQNTLAPVLIIIYKI